MKIVAVRVMMLSTSDISLDISVSGLLLWKCKFEMYFYYKKSTPSIYKDRN